MTFTDPPSGEQYPQDFCAACFDEILRAYPEVSKELQEAESQSRPAQIKSLPPEMIPESFQKRMRARHGRPV
jgi:hypothetical protein